MAEDATSPLVTRDMLRAELYRTHWFFATGIIAAFGVIAGAIVALTTAVD